MASKRVPLLLLVGMSAAMLAPGLAAPWGLGAPPAGSGYSCAVTLVSPAARATLEQERNAGGTVVTKWRFAWSGCPGATRYHLYVIGPGAQNPLVDLDTLTTTTHTTRSTHHGITSRQGWTWRVRAFSGGRWGGWSEQRTFDVGEVGQARLLEGVACRAVRNDEPSGKASVFYRGQERVCRFMRFGSVAGKHRVRLMAFRNGKHEGDSMDSFADPTRQTPYKLWFCDKRRYGQWREQVILDDKLVGTITYSVLDLDQDKVD